MKDVKALRKANAFKDVLQKGVKTWFFYLETKAEYQDSRKCCLDWIDGESSDGKVGVGNGFSTQKMDQRS